MIYKIIFSVREELCDTLLFRCELKARTKDNCIVTMTERRFLLYSACSRMLCLFILCFGVTLSAGKGILSLNNNNNNIIINRRFHSGVYAQEHEEYAAAFFSSKSRFLSSTQGIRRYFALVCCTGWLHWYIT